MYRREADKILRNFRSMCTGSPSLRTKSRNILEYRLRSIYMDIKAENEKAIIQFTIRKNKAHEKAIDVVY